MASANIKIVVDGVEYAVTQIEQLASATETAADATDDLTAAQEKNVKETKDAATETGFLTEKYEDLQRTFGKLKADFKLATKGIQTFFTTGTSGAKLLKVAFASTGIGLLIVAIVSLIDYFKDTEEGSRVLTVAFESVGVIINLLVDTIAKFGKGLIDAFKNPKEAIMGFYDTLKEFVIDKINQLIDGIGLLGEAIKAVFEGDFSKAGDLAAEGFTKIGDSVLALNPATAVLYQLGDAIINDVIPAITDAVTATNNLVKAQRALRDMQQQLIVENANLTKELELNQKIAEDTTLSYEERAAALDRVNAANIKLAQNAAKEAKANEDTIRQELALTSAYEAKEELQTKLAEAVAERIARETELQIKQQEAAKLSRELDKEELDRKQAIQDTIDSLRLENITDEREAAREGLRIAEESAVKELQALRASEEEIKALRAEFAVSRENLEKDFAEKDAALLDEKLQREETAAEFLRQQTLDAQQAEIDAIRLKYEEQIALAGDNAELAAQLADQREQAIAKVEDKYRQEKIDKDKEAQRLAVENGFKLASAGLQAIAALNEAAAGDSEEEQRKAFNRNKALQIGIATIQTAQAVTAALTAGGNPVKLATGAQFVEAAFVAAQGLAQIIKIKNTKFSPSGGGGGGNPGVSSPPSFNAQGALDTLNDSTASLQDPGRAIQPGQLSSGQTPTIKAYVVATEMTSQQEANKNIDNLAKL